MKNPKKEVSLRRKILNSCGYLDGCMFGKPCKWCIKITEALLSLFEKEMMSIIGEDEGLEDNNYEDEMNVIYMRGRNRLRKLLREKVKKLVTV